MTFEQAIAFVERTSGGVVDKASREHFRQALDLLGDHMSDSNVSCGGHQWKRCGLDDADKWHQGIGTYRWNVYVAVCVRRS